MLYTFVLSWSFTKEYFQGLILFAHSQQKPYSYQGLDPKYKPKRPFCKGSSISEFIVDETQIRVGSEYVWLWVAIEPENRRILALDISKERNTLLLLRDLLQV